MYENTNTSNHYVQMSNYDIFCMNVSCLWFLPFFK